MARVPMPHAGEQPAFCCIGGETGYMHAEVGGCSVEPLIKDLRLKGCISSVEEGARPSHELVTCREKKKVMRCQVNAESKEW